jgi:MoaE-MoaD fusion protein
MMASPQYYSVVDRPVTTDAVLARVAGEGFGGIVTFTGTVRARSRDRDVLRLEYEAYVPMAEKVLARIGDEIAKRWPGTRTAIDHRIGVLAVGEVAVAIAVAAPHRAEAFEGCRHAIERLKEDVPIWKREVFTDGSEWVGMGP